MLLLFNAYTDHSSQAIPVPWAGRQLSHKKGQMDDKSEVEMFFENQAILINYCKKQRSDIAIKFFGKTGDGWLIHKLDPIWAQCARFFRQLSSGGIISSHKKCNNTDIDKKPVESMWILSLCHSTNDSFQVCQVYQPKFSTCKLFFLNY